MRLVVSGGHLTPALALIQHANKFKDEILVIGRHYSSHKHQIESREKSEVENLGANFTAINALKIHRDNKLKSILSSPKFAVGLAQSFRQIRAFQPDVVVSFGGYLAVPITLAAKALRIPIVSHEQTITAGLANQIIAKFADQIAISWPESKPFFPQKKTSLTGNPLRQEIIHDHPPIPSWLANDKSLPIIYISGGNQGSHVINHTLETMLASLTKKYYLVHQCGSSHTHKYFTSLNLARQKLPTGQKNNYVIREWFSAPEISWILKNSYLTISRAGANTVTEIMHVGVPSIFIPLPFSYKNEQLKNAQMVAGMNATEILLQSKLTPKTLLVKINKIKHSYKKYQLNARKLSRLLVPNSASKLYSLINIYEKKTKTKKAKASF